LTIEILGRYLRNCDSGPSPEPESKLPWGTRLKNSISKTRRPSLEVRGQKSTALIALAVTFAVAQNNNIKQVLHAIVVIGKLCGTTATGGVLGGGVVLQMTP
jgi:hypothetical protein